MSNTKAVIVLLTLAGVGEYTRRDLIGPDLLPVKIKKGDTIAVTEEMAEVLTGDDYVTMNSDDEPVHYFEEAKASAKVTHDFTGTPTVAAATTGAPVAEPVAEPVVTHDPSALPDTKTLTEAVADGSIGKPAARTSQRAPRAATK